MLQLLTLPNILLAVGGLVTAATYFYSTFSKATQTQQAARLATVEKYVAMAYHAVAANASATATVVDDYVAAVLKQVDDTLKAQGKTPLAPPEIVAAKLQTAAMAGKAIAIAGPP